MIRKIRKSRGKTLETVAKTAGISKSTLSKIENGQLSSPISTLLSLADAMGVRLTEFFTEPHDSPSYVITRKSKGPVIVRDGSQLGYSYEAIALDFPGRQVDPFILTINPGDREGKFEHDGQEFLHILSGATRMKLGAEEFILNKGDSLYFDPTHTHSLQALHDKPVQLLCIFIQSPTL